MTRKTLTIVAAFALALAGCGTADSESTTKPADNGAAKVVDLLSDSVIEKTCDQVDLFGRAAALSSFKARYQASVGKEVAGVSAEEAFDEVLRRC
jgi:hypothetical protein